jgi:hypothetical protein
MTHDRHANQAPAFFLLGALVANGALFGIADLPLTWALCVVATLVVVVWTAPHVPIVSKPSTPLRGSNVAIGLAILMPVLLSLALGWNRELPFSGDHTFHAITLYQIAVWWLSPPARPLVRSPEFHDLTDTMRTFYVARIVLLLAIVAISWVAGRRHRVAALAVATTLLLTWGFFEHATFLRYPTGGYLMALPFAGIGFWTGLPTLPGRLRNVAAVAAWLFLLRPVLLKRWPDPAVVAAGVLLLWHADVVYYVDSNYLEACAVVFALLAVEALVDRGADGAPLAALLIGAAATVKEPFVLALPVVWLIAQPWSRSRREAASITGSALAAGVPFLVYLVARQSITDVDATRSADFSQPLDALPAFFAQWLHRMAIAFGRTGSVVALAALVLIPVIAVRIKERRAVAVGMAAAGIGIALLFALDRHSAPWAGYFRFALCSAPFLAVGALAAGRAFGTRAALALGVAFAIGQAPSAVSAVARAAGPSSGLTFVEHYEAPLLFPIRSLILEARARGTLPQDGLVVANRPDAAVAGTLRLNLAFLPLGELACECRPDRPYVLALFVRYVNLNAPYADGPPPPGTIAAWPFERDRLWRAQRAACPACVAQLRETCASVIERVEGGDVVGVLGAR